ncbi:unnamed protein product [Cochlearia groenlandica]
MLGTKVASLVLFMVFVLCIGSHITNGRESIAPWIDDMNSICCREHPKLGRCLPNIDDNPEKNGKCWKYCIQGCERGGFCKLFGSKHICHCYCSG